MLSTGMPFLLDLLHAHCISSHTVVCQIHFKRQNNLLQKQEII